MPVMLMCMECVRIKLDMCRVEACAVDSSCSTVSLSKMYVVEHMDLEHMHKVHFFARFRARITVVLISIHLQHYQ